MPQLIGRLQPAGLGDSHEGEKAQCAGYRATRSVGYFWEAEFAEHSRFEFRGEDPGLWVGT